MLVIIAMLSVPLLFGLFLILFGVWFYQGKISRFHLKYMAFALLLNFLFTELYYRFFYQGSLIQMPALKYHVMDFIFACLLITSCTFVGIFVWLILLKRYPLKFNKFKPLNLITILLFSVASFMLYQGAMLDVMET